MGESYNDLSLFFFTHPVTLYKRLPNMYYPFDDDAFFSAALIFMCIFLNEKSKQTLFFSNIAFKIIRTSIFKFNCLLVLFLFVFIKKYSQILKKKKLSEYS